MKRYSCYATKSCYGEIEQLWVVFCSEEMKKKEQKTFEEKVLKKLEATEKFLRKLSNHEFACEVDAKMAAKKMVKENESYEFTKLEITTRNLSEKCLSALILRHSIYKTGTGALIL